MRLWAYWAAGWTAVILVLLAFGKREEALGCFLGMVLAVVWKKPWRLVRRAP